MGTAVEQEFLGGGGTLTEEARKRFFGQSAVSPSRRSCPLQCVIEVGFKPAGLRPPGLKRAPAPQNLLRQEKNASANSLEAERG
jgi:hypothetical protein